MVQAMIPRQRRIAQVMLFTVVGLGVWIVGFRSSSPDPVLPESTTQFSLDMDVVASADVGLVYVVEHLIESRALRMVAA
jgi:hypothetical protein